MKITTNFINALEDISKDRAIVSEATYNAVRDSLAEWAENVANDADRFLQRPHWLLSKSIASKVVEYRKDNKVYAMAGFRFQAGRALNIKRNYGYFFPDPGYYGQFFEGGKRKGGAPYKTIDHFLRRAKDLNAPKLESIVARHFNRAQLEMIQEAKKRLDKEDRNRKKGVSDSAVPF